MAAADERRALEGLSRAYRKLITGGKPPPPPEQAERASATPQTPVLPAPESPGGPSAHEG